ncbi:MAG: hypothetical protein GY811_18660, partial [Myxococcales bacterium]|nr:hypothetical protein [Myxococcales bacterium]
VGRWREHIALLERRSMTSADTQERRALALRIANVTAEELADHRGAFEWYSQAHELSPDATTIGELRRAAESYGLWRELANVYEGDREQLRGGAGISDTHSFVQLCKDIAQIAEAKLRDPKRAIDALLRRTRSLSARSTPNDRGRACRPRSRSKACLGTTARVLQLAHRRSRGRGAYPASPSACNAARRPDSRPRGRSRRPTRRILLGRPNAAAYARHSTFGDRNRDHWQRILTTETALAERASTNAERLAILRRKAEAYEKNANDHVRAFQTHITAFILSPEDEETLSHLWRLARHVGRYADFQRSPQMELPGASIAAGETAPNAGCLRAAAKKARREATQELSISDLVDDGEPGGMSEATIDEDPELAQALIANESPVGESTQELDISELLDSDPSAPVHDPTMELRTEDLIEALGRKPLSTPPPPPQAPKQRNPGQEPPPPPPKRPEIQPMPGVAQVKVASSTVGQVTLQTSEVGATRQALPCSPVRAYSPPLVRTRVRLLQIAGR